MPAFATCYVTPIELAQTQRLLAIPPGTACEQAVARWKKLPGIGEWTAQDLAMRPTRHHSRAAATRRALAAVARLAAAQLWHSLPAP